MAIATEAAIHDEIFDKKKVKLISFISFLLGFSQAFLMYVLSAYFKQALGSENVSVFFFGAYAVVLLLLLNIHKLIKKLGEETTFFLLALAQVGIGVFLVFFPPSVVGILLLMAYIVVSYLVIVVLDIILEAFSDDRRSGRIRGLHLVIVNAGFLLGPFLSTHILKVYDFSGLFFISMLINMCIFVVGLIGLRSKNSKFDGELTARDLVKKVFVNSNLMRIYAISVVLEFFYALMVVYTPLYLLDRGLGWDSIGIIFTIMLIPFVILQYPAGVLADKKIGEKEMIIAALIIMAISTISVFFIRANSILVWGAVLFLTRIGAALIEVLRDSYFYKKIDGRNMDIISFFRTARSVAYISAAALSALLLLFFPLKSIFLLVAFVALIALYPAFKLQDSRSEKELAADC